MHEVNSDGVAALQSAVTTAPTISSKASDCREDQRGNHKCNTVSWGGGTNMTSRNIMAAFDVP